jgi:hypothetical protein
MTLQWHWHQKIVHILLFFGAGYAAGIVRTILSGTGLVKSTVAAGI